MLYPSNVFNESLWAVILFMYILFIIYLTKRIFNYMVKRNVKTNVAIYYNRKLIHMLAGGVIALLVPYVFSSPLVPTVFALIIALILYIPHRKKNLLNWFQVSDNAYEVNFAISWGLSLLLVWLITNNPYYAIIPPLFISFGDAVTGIIRNGLYGVRTKSWYGNLGMILVTVPIGFYFAKVPGLLAAVASSIIEHFEIPPLLDDNVLIGIASSLILIVSTTTPMF
ncbi:MAG: dolichol kinase [Desulfurococcaceae archaeon]